MGHIATGPRAGARVQRLGRARPARTSRPGSRRPLGPMTAETEGFNLHAGVRVAACRRRQLERLCSYILRPPVNQERLEMLADGRVAYQLKQPWSDGTTAVAFQPGELLEKLAALVPPPRVHQTRYHGVLSSHARLRPAVVPAPAPDAPGSPCHPARPRRMPWAELLRRVHALDLFACPHCSGRMRIIAAITQTTVIRAILRACGLPAAPPARGRPVLATCQQSEPMWPPNDASLDN